MAAEIVTVSPRHIWRPEPLQRLWFFPHGSTYLRYAAHFHLIFPGGFRQNIPLNNTFVIVLNGKFSIKNYQGNTFRKVEVRDQVWYDLSSGALGAFVYKWAANPYIKATGGRI